jgi:hypothetical protein
MVVYLGAFTTTLTPVAAWGASAIASVKDVDPLDIKVEIIGSDGLPKAGGGGPGTSIGPDETLSIAKWCEQHKAKRGNVVVIDRFGEERLDCGGKEVHTFTDRGAVIPPIHLSVPNKPTTSTITTERPWAAPTIAVSPSRSSEGLGGQPAKAEDLLRKQEGFPSTEGTSKSVAPR